MYIEADHLKNSPQQQKKRSKSKSIKCCSISLCIWYMSLGYYYATMACIYVIPIYISRRQFVGKIIQACTVLWLHFPLLFTLLHISNNRTVHPLVLKGKRIPLDWFGEITYLLVSTGLFCNLKTLSYTYLFSTLIGSALWLTFKWRVNF